MLARKPNHSTRMADLVDLADSSKVPVPTLRHNRSIKTALEDLADSSKVPVPTLSHNRSIKTALVDLEESNKEPVPTHRPNRTIKTGLEDLAVKTLKPMRKPSRTTRTDSVDLMGSTVRPIRPKHRRSRSNRAEIISMGHNNDPIIMGMAAARQLVQTRKVSSRADLEALAVANNKMLRPQMRVHLRLNNFILF